MCVHHLVGRAAELFEKMRTVARSMALPPMPRNFGDISVACLYWRMRLETPAKQGRFGCIT